tara:strand:- start:154 stop:645 length:492 start_codon:yes stop_codon:yes gene_type:complete
MLNSLIIDINKFNNVKNEIDFTEKKTNIPEKMYRGNQHDLDTYLNTIKYMEYKKKLRKNVRQSKEISSENTFNNLDDIHKHLEKNQFNCKWSRLDNYLKKIKLKEYINAQIKDDKLCQSKKEEVFKKLINLLNKKKLNKSTEIVYDIVEGKISKIINFEEIIL